jgi:hypothetical protein
VYFKVTDGYWVVRVAEVLMVVGFGWLEDGDGGWRLVGVKVMVADGCRLVKGEGG